MASDKSAPAAPAAAPANEHDPDAITSAPPAYNDTMTELRGKEKAAEFLASAGQNTSFTYEEEKRVVRRVDFRVLSILLIAYFFQQLDKSSLSYVSIFGLTEDAHLVGKEYSWLGSILYLAQLIMQPLASFLLVKLPTGKLLAGAVFFWGASLTIMAACTDFKSLLGLRFCLGSFEAMIGALSCWAASAVFFEQRERLIACQ